MMTILCQWDYKEQIEKIVRLLLCTSKKFSRIFQDWVLLYPSSKRKVNRQLYTLKLKVKVNL
jgi:hypothetical protein